MSQKPVTQDLPRVRELFPGMFDTDADASAGADQELPASSSSQPSHPQSFDHHHNTLPAGIQPGNTRLSSSTYIPQKKYVCEDCDAKFARPCELKTHSTKHTGERPFACPLCGRKFSTSSNVSRHLKTLHPGQAVPATTS